MGEYAGSVNLVVDEKYGEIQGASMIGSEVTELLPGLILAHMLELTLKKSRATYMPTRLFQRRSWKRRTARWDMQSRFRG